MATLSNNERIGSRLQKCREDAHVTQKEMADACSLSKNYISALERGVNKCSVLTLLGYCEKLEMTPNEILGFGDSEINVELRTLLSKQSAEKQKDILTVVKTMLKQTP